MKKSEPLLFHHFNSNFQKLSNIRAFLFESELRHHTRTLIISKRFFERMDQLKKKKKEIGEKKKEKRKKEKKERKKRRKKNLHSISKSDHRELPDLQFCHGSRNKREGFASQLPSLILSHTLRIINSDHNLIIPLFGLKKGEE